MILIGDQERAALDLQNFLLHAKDTGDWTDDTVIREQMIELLTAKINAISLEGNSQVNFKIINY